MQADLYALIGGLYQRDEKEKPFERLLVIDPDGRIVQTYNKMWSDARFNDCPGMFADRRRAVPAAICADRWIRSVEELAGGGGGKNSVRVLEQLRQRVAARSGLVLVCAAGDSERSVRRFCEHREGRSRTATRRDTGIRP